MTRKIVNFKIDNGTGPDGERVFAFNPGPIKDGIHFGIAVVRD